MSTTHQVPKITYEPMQLPQRNRLGAGAPLQWLKEALGYLRAQPLPSAVYGLVIVLFGRSILTTFGPGFEDGFPALLWITGGAITSTLFAVGPSFLLYVGRGAVVLRWSAVALLLNIALCATLGGRLGALGGAIAYAISMGGLFVTLRFAALAEFERVFGWEQP